ncbi:hypothetical protein HDV05_001740 [Chytridiales sp. JEL 0842]|nr:hypothetical protein HDV05_001740 [Chytridiales sp. JEL 0842]
MGFAPAGNGTEKCAEPFDAGPQFGLKENMPHREYIPSGFVPAPTVDGSSASAIAFISKQGSRFEIQVLDHDIVRVRHIPPSSVIKSQSTLRTLTGQIPQLSTHSLDPSENRNAQRGLNLDINISGVDRDRVAQRFPCPPPDIEISSHVTFIKTDQLTIQVSIEPSDGDISLTWSSTAAEVPFLEDLKHRSYPLFKDSLGARHFVTRRDQDLHYGLGERGSPITLNRRRFRLETMDALGYDPQNTDTLYKLIPFHITLDTKTRQAHGVFYDSLSAGAIDFGNEIDAFWGPYRSYTVSEGYGLDMYVIFGPSMEKVVEGYTRIVGRPTLPPKYALGYLASSMGYAESESAQQFIAELPALCRKWDIPCDLLHLSSGYTVDPTTGARNVFTWNKKRFPDPEKFVKDLRTEGIRIAANIKPWLLSRHPEYTTLLNDRGYIWDEESNGPSITRLWSAGGGATATGSYIDLSSKGGREFWKRGVSTLLRMGIEGIWNDNNEFALPDDNHLYQRSNAGSTPSTVGSAGRALQTMLMASASYEALRETAPNRRPFLITRSGSPGIQRFAAQTWSGDNYSSWETLKHNIPMGLNAGLSGLAGYGHDVGGFVGPRPEKELFVRWVQNGVFHPRFCIHSWKDEGVTEPWMYPDVVPIIREAIHLRYKLLPYLYNLHHEAARHGHPVIRPLVYHFQLDPTVQSASFEFLLGPSLLVASVFEAGATTRTLYLPSGTHWCNVWTGDWYKGGQSVTLDVPLSTCGGLLAHAGSLVPTGPVVQYVGEPGKDNERLVWCFPTPSSLVTKGTKLKSAMVLVEDDGESFDAPVSEFKVWMEASDTEVVVGYDVLKRGYKVTFDKIWFVLPHGDQRTLRAAVGNEDSFSRVGDDGRQQIGISLIM